MPTQHGSSPLEAAWSFYASIVTVSSEGDSVVSDDTLEGLGTVGSSIFPALQALFGTLVKLASQPPIPKTPPRPSPSSSDSATTDLSTAPSSPMATMAVAGMNEQLDTINAQLDNNHLQTVNGVHCSQEQGQAEEATERGQFRLTQYLPAPGYFLAGAVSGGVSRTATAPLDRLKVYLLVNTKNPVSAAVDVAKQGRPVAALQTSYKPITDAVVTLWKAGGIRTFFAGEYL
jgi:solute carrier family 25 phosphate transporter 23/24/25/41